jgi:hypothetical protein
MHAKEIGSAWIGLGIGGDPGYREVNHGMDTLLKKEKIICTLILGSKIPHSNTNNIDLDLNHWYT